MNTNRFSTTFIALAVFLLTGCAATGGQFYNAAGEPLTWMDVDDHESIRAIHAALDEGVNFFDTADVYSVGMSEEIDRVVARALARDPQDRYASAGAFARGLRGAES